MVKVLNSGAPRGRCYFIGGIALFALAGCAALPSSGPTGSQIRKDASVAATEALGAPITIVELDSLDRIPAPLAPVPGLPPSPVPPTDVLGPGDLIDVAVYETGVTLFGGTGSAPAAVAGLSYDPSTQVERMPAIRVDDQGYVRFPFVGRIQAAGLSTTQLAARIKAGLAGMSQNPEVLVSMRDTFANSVVVGGEVGRPGKLALSSLHERLGDVIALSGGYRGDPKDLAARIQRGTISATYYLSDMLAYDSMNPRIQPGDKVSVVRAVRSYAIMGAPGKVAQVPFAAPRVSLAEAIAEAGGANPNLGDPRAIFVFRFVADETGQPKPTVFHVNMMRTNGYFVSQKFSMQDKDILYIGNASANQPSKLVQIVSQLFAPIVTVRDIVRSTN